MNGKIDGLPQTPQNTQANRSSRPANNQTQSQDSQAAAGDQVSLTASALNLQHVEQTLAATPAVDHNRVDAIREALANGSYQVNSQRIADGLVKSEQALGKLE